MRDLKIICLDYTGKQKSQRSSSTIHMSMGYLLRIALTNGEQIKRERSPSIYESGGNGWLYTAAFSGR